MEETLEQQLFKATLAIIQASYDTSNPKNMTVGEFKIKYKHLFEEHERLEKLLKEKENGKE